MYFLTALQLLSVAIALCAGTAAALGDPAAPQTTAAAGPPADLQSCLQQTGDYVTRGRIVVYVIGVTNTCAKRLRCEIYANISGAKGNSLGHTVMTLGPSGSAAAKQTYTMRVKSAGGIAQISRECKVL